MAKHFKLILGENSNWEVAFFLLIDKFVPSLKSETVFSRQNIVGSSGMNFLHNLLSPIGYEVNKTLENTLQGTINNMVKKKKYILSNGYGEYTLTEIGYNRLIEIQKKYDSKQKQAIGATGKALLTLEFIPDKEIREKVLRDFLAQIK